MATSTYDKPNIAPKSKDGKETNPPKSVSYNNSSSSSQNDGPSLPKSAQGVLRDTLTEWNNAIPTSGCPIKLPNIIAKLETKLKLTTETEVSRVAEWGKKLGELIAPIVEVIDNAVSALNSFMKQIKKYIDDLMEIIKEIQEWVQLAMDFINFVMSLPARLMKLIENCLNAVMTGVQEYVGETFQEFTSGINEGLNIPMNVTPTPTAT